ncbi:hypothetical protein IID10_15725 [candidate division KSB1 bacterium]|nr:hypothetical protein [candidate division KSB1 bacterium]
MAKCIKNYVFIFLVISSPLQLSAQGNSEGQIKLLFDIVKNTREAAAQTHFDTLAPDVSLVLSRHLVTIENIAKSLNPGFSAALRLTQKDFDVDNLFFDNTTALYSAIQGVKTIFIGDLLPELEKLEKSEEDIDTLIAPIEDVMNQQLKASLERRLNNLRNYEIKFGPNSAKLNFAEAVVNHFLLRNVPGFGIDNNFSPEPLEIILAYSTAYVTSTDNINDDNKLKLLSGAEIGLRCYIFRKGWGEGNILKPNFVSGGVLISRENSGFLSNPFNKDNGDLRLGMFLSWGVSIKAAYIFSGDGSKFFLSKQIQFIPLLF